MTRRNTKEKFWSLVEVKGPDECWPWKGKRNRDGYAQWYWKGLLRMVHHIAFQIHSGCFFPRKTRKVGSGGIVIRHKCDNPPCCNPAHLLKGTQLDNVKDMWEKHRNPNLQGEYHPGSKVTKTQVLQIRRIFQKKRFTKAQLAEQFGLTVYGISSIVQRKTWKHLL